MKRRIIYLGLYCSIIMIILLNSASAVQYFQYNYFMNDNYTTRMHGQIGYSTFERPIKLNRMPDFSTNIFDIFGSIFANAVEDFKVTYSNNNTLSISEDSIENGRPLEVYVLFSTWVDESNRNTPAYNVSFCNFTIGYSSFLTPNITTNVFSQTSATTITNAKYFLRLQKGDSAEFNLDCIFSNNRSLEIPASFTVVSPSWECKECQMYLWSQDYVKLNTASSLGTYKTIIWGYVTGLVKLNYEIIIILFWVILIELFLFIVGILITSLFWLYLWFRSMSK
jgi:hypothetical protein